MPRDALVPVSLVREIVKASIDRAIAGSRIPKILTGSVEDLDSDTLDVAYVRLDQEAMASDPTQSDNWGAPGIIPTTRLGDTVLGEQVRVTFDGVAGASATRTSGPGVGQRMAVDATSGVISFYDDADRLVGYLDATRWALGDLDTPGARITLDPIGGLRIRSSADVLVSTLDQAGYSLRNTTSGLVVAEIKAGSVRLVDEAGTDDIELVTTSGSSLPNPKYTSAVEANPGTTVVAPSAALFTTTPADDIDIYHAAAWLADTVQSATWTPPAGATERLDNTISPDDSTLSTSVATRDPASGVAGTFTSDQSNWQHGIGTHVIVKGGGATSPAFRSESHTASVFTTGTGLTLTLDKPSGVVQGDVLVAFVTMGNDAGSVPIGWTRPEGWTFLGANFRITGSGATQSTLAVGAWVKLAGASEPSAYQVSVQMGVGRKTFSACIVAIQTPTLIPGGAHIRIAGHPIRRLLAFTELTAAAQTLCDFQNIPQGFDHLELIYDGQSDIGTDVARRALLRFNNDTGANYHRQTTSDGTITQALNATGLHLGAVDGATAAHRTSGQFTIFNYAAADRARSMLGHATWIGTLDIRDDSLVGYWNNTAAAIDRIQVLVDTGGAGIVKFAAGSRAYLYGY